MSSNEEEYEIKGKDAKGKAMIESCNNFWRTTWQRGLIVLVCLFLILSRLIWPDLAIDWITIVLVAIATVAVLLPSYDTLWPQVSQVLPYVKKLKVAGLEVELSEEIKKLSKEVEVAKESLTEQKKMFSTSDVYEQSQSEVLEVLKTDSRAALMVLAARIEQMVMIRLAQKDLRAKGHEIPISRAMALGVEKGVFPEEVMEPFREFWELRNRVAHGQAFEVEPNVVQSLVSIGLEVLKLVSLEEENGSGN